MALNPHQKNKVDINSLTEEEQKLFRLYGKLPNKKDIFSKKLQERKYFDSGDYAMSKAGKTDGASIGGGLGREHPTPENIPHLSQVQSVGSPPASDSRGSISAASTTGPILSPSISHPAGAAGSPVKESSILQQGISVDDQDDEEPAKADDAKSPAEPRGIPIRK